MTDPGLLQRVLILEARDAIRQLKARYLASCDRKDPAAFRTCFVDGPVSIDYGPVGQFSDADALTAVFQQAACHGHMLEWHHASNPEIEVLSTTQARGSWSLHYQLINTQEQTLTQLGGEYADEYRLTDSGWKISATRFEPRTSLVLQLDETAVKTLLAGTPPAAAG